jgi:hypothetical protein
LRPTHVFAKPSADDELHIVALLRGPWRFALSLVMIWLSLRGLTASEIAALFEYDPRTVRRRIDRYNEKGVAGLEDRPRSGAPRLGGAGLGRRLRMLLREPGAWTVSSCGVGWGTRRCRWQPWPGECASRPAGAGPGWSPRVTPTRPPYWPRSTKRSRPCPRAR